MSAHTCFLSILLYSIMTHVAILCFKSCLIPVLSCPPFREYILYFFLETESLFLTGINKMYWMVPEGYILQKFAMLPDLSLITNLLDGFFRGVFLTYGLHLDFYWYGSNSYIFHIFLTVANFSRWVYRVPPQHAISPYYSQWGLSPCKIWASGDQCFRLYI